MTKAAYFEKFENLAFSRDDGVLTLRFHTNGGPVVFTGQTHEDLPAALEEVALDLDNHALVITGTGDSFMDQIDGPSLGEIFKPGAWEKTRSEGTKILQRLLANDAGLVCKVLGTETEPVLAKVREFWRLVRHEALGAPIPERRPWTQH